MRHQGQLAAVAQLVERVLGKDEVMGSNPISSFKRDKLKIKQTIKNGATTARRQAVPIQEIE